MNFLIRLVSLVLPLSVLPQLLPAAASTNAIPNQDCFECHEDKTAVMTNKAGKVISIYTDEQKFKHSIHADTRCVECHSDIKELPHDEIKLKPVNCGECHEEEVKAHDRSIHGLASRYGVTNVATCADCHGAPHEMLAADNTNSPTHHSRIPEICTSCHGDAEVMAKYSFARDDVVVTYDKSVHGLALATNGVKTAVCTDCHGVHDIVPSSETSSKLFWQNIPTTCGKCHKEIQKTFDRSVHGVAAKKNERDAPICTDCHGEHKIAAVALAESKVSPANIPETCGQCHKAERIATRYGFQTNVVATYVESFHGLAAGIGGVSAANCASCHGVHDILPSSDPASTINAAHLPDTCGKCHPGIGTRFATGEIKIHQPPGTGKGPKERAVAIVTRVYLVVIIVVIGGMLLHNGLDYLRKIRMHIRAVRANPGELRMTRLMQVQHVLLILTFVILAYTGFVHKFPDSWWSWPFRAIADGSFHRGLWHRIAGWLFTGVFGVHLVLLFGTARGRAYLQHLGLKWHDATDAMVMTKFNLGLAGAPPPHRRFNYIEKAEYWALVWGSFVMIITGVMLIFTEAVLYFLPKIWLDLAQVIHLYEAVLATLAIVVWHFYWVIFDPSEYPFNTAWIIGHKAAHHPGGEQGGHDRPASERQAP